MAVRKYAGEEAVSRISEYVNKKLTVVSTVPTSPTKLRNILYIGPTTEDYVQGCVYLYDEDNDEWVLTDLASLHETSWTGTQDEWNALTSDEQAKYEIVNFTDDFSPSGDHVISGYYYQEQFYEEDTHTTLIEPMVGYIYVDLPNNTLYLYDDVEDEYVLAGGGSFAQPLFIDSENYISIDYDSI